MVGYYKEEKAECVEWFIKVGKNFVAFQRKYRRHFGKHSAVLNPKSIKE